tara:strand:+ start:28 stop:897 length:870 start_codon:yes stop_codon:yes gene_type:complete
MAMIGKPQVLSYGNSFATAYGTNLEDATPKGDISRDKLNVGTLGETAELSHFDENVKDFVLARLGHPVVRVELTVPQIKTCVDEAVTKLQYHAPMWTKQFATFGASAGINIYEIPPYILDNLEYVVYHKTLLTIQQKAGTLEFDFFIKYFQDNFLFQNFGVADFYLLQSNLEQMRKILGMEGTWDIINNQYLQLYPAPVTTPDQVILEYRALDSNTIHPAYRNWIQRYALAIAKGILGEIRGKYTTLPSPGGGASLNGQQLIEQSIREKEILDKELLTELEEPIPFTLF